LSNGAVQHILLALIFDREMPSHAGAGNDADSVMAVAGDFIVLVGQDHTKHVLEITCAFSPHRLSFLKIPGCVRFIVVNRMYQPAGHSRYCALRVLRVLRVLLRTVDA
jgi:hypothetical protein